MLLQYSYVPDILEKRGPYREQHLAGANKMVGRVAVEQCAASRASPSAAHAALRCCPQRRLSSRSW